MEKEKTNQTTNQEMESNGRYFIWPDDMPMPDSKNRCYGCSTVLVIPQGQKFTLCPACGGNPESLERVQQRIQMYIDEDLNPHHAANKVRKEIREGKIEV